MSRCLKKFLKDNVNERQKLRIKNVSYDTMMDFVKYLYTGIIPSKDTRVKELLRVANNFGLPLLRQICENELLGTIS